MVLTPEEETALQRIAEARQETVQRATRARILREYAAGTSIPGLVHRYGLTAHVIGRTVKKALAYGVLEALQDLPRSGRPVQISAEARAWIVSLACQKPTAVG